MNCHPPENAGRNVRRARRRGAVAVVAIVILAVAGLVVGALVRRALAAHRQQRADENRAQAMFLAEAAAEGLQAKVREGAESFAAKYSLAVADGRQGTVEAAVAADPDRPGERRMTVTASFPADLERPAFVRLSRSLPAKKAAAAPAAELRSESTSTNPD